MNREFLDLYNRELKVLREQARDFSEQYPGIAERLGGLVEERSDPAIVGLLEGAAFLAARVQLKLKHEFPEFTSNLLEQLVPNFLAPTPSALLAKVRPTYGDPGLREGRQIKRGSYLDATYRERERRVACRYRLASDVTIWPFDLVAAEYFGSPGPLQALGIGTSANVAGGFRLTLTHRLAARIEDEPSDRDPAARQPMSWFAGCPLKELTFFLTGPEADAAATYEQVFASRAGVFLRYLDEFGDPVSISVPTDAIRPIGFERHEALIPNDPRIFEGFDFLREYFMFPRKFLGFQITSLGPLIDRVTAKTLDIVIAVDEINPRLSAATSVDAFALYAAPAINLFEMSLDRVPVRQREHEYHLVPDRSRYLDFEPHRVVEVYAHYTGVAEKVPVPPLYSAEGGVESQAGLYYTIRRDPRRQTAREKTFGASSDYIGTDVFLSLSEPARLDDEASIAELSLRALCSNRHLPEQLPVGEGGADFRLADDVSLDVMCVAGPTRPREPVVRPMRSRSESAATGAVTWRLINMLSLNHLGIVERGAGGAGRALREMLTVFADLTDSTVERRIRGIRSVDSRPVVRRLRRRTGTGTARGTEITVLFDDKAFEGTGPFLLGAVLERFFAEYAGLNHFTQLVMRTVERGEVMRWPPRSGSRRPL